MTLLWELKKSLKSSCKVTKSDQGSSVCLAWVWIRKFYPLMCHLLDALLGYLIPLLLWEREAQTSPKGASINDVYKNKGGGGLICIYWWCHCYYVDEGGRGSENWQNLVDVIYGRPLLLNQKCSLERGNTIRALLCNIYFQYSAVLCNKQYWKLCIFYPHAKISASRTVWHIAHTMHIQLLGVTALQRTSELQNSSSKVWISATFLGETEFA